VTFTFLHFCHTGQCSDEGRSFVSEATDSPIQVLTRPDVE